MTKTTTTNSAINWIIERSAVVFDSTDEFEGQMIHAITRQFEGKLPGRMGDEMRKWFKENGTMRDTNRQVVYNVATRNGNVSMTTGAFKSTWNAVNVVINEYQEVHEIDEYNAEWLAYLS